MHAETYRPRALNASFCTRRDTGLPSLGPGFDGESHSVCCDPCGKDKDGGVPPQPPPHEPEPRDD